MKAALACFAVGLAACPPTVGTTSDDCSPAWSIGPGTCGVEYSVCVPRAYANCGGANCCQFFCGVPGGCGAGITCLSIPPDAVPAFLPADVASQCACAAGDGGGGGAGSCICADGGSPCYAADCLSICGSSNSST